MHQPGALPGPGPHQPSQCHPAISVAGPRASPGSCPAAPRRWPWAVSGSVRPHPPSTARRPGRASSFYRRPPFDGPLPASPPRHAQWRDGRASVGSSRGDAADRTPREGVADTKQRSGQLRHPGQGPALVLGVAIRGRAALQLGFQPLQPGLVQAALLPTGALGGQGLDAAGLPGPVPAVGRHPAHPEPAGHLRYRNSLGEQVGGRETQLFSSGACGGGQPATFGVPHASGMTATERSSHSRRGNLGSSTSAAPPDYRLLIR